MKSIVRKNDEAVSPVIATILMVAITVVLAAVLYVMVSGLISPTGNAPKAIGVAVTKSSNGANWILTFTSVPTGLSNTTTTLTVTTTAGGSTAVTAKPLGDLTATYFGTNGVQYIASLTTGQLGAGDRILLALTTFPAGDQYSISSSGSILASGTLQ